MSYFKKYQLTILIILLLASCSHVKKRETFSLLPLEKGIPTFLPPPITSINNNSVSKKQNINRGNVLTLEEVLKLVLKNNSKLMSSSWNIRKGESSIIQSDLSLNPEVEFKISDSNTGESEVTVSQEFELGGKRSSRLRVANNELEEARLEYESIRLALINETKTIFHETYSLQKKIHLLSEAVLMANKVLTSVKERVRRGASHRVEVTRADLALAASNIRLSKIKREFVAKQHALARLWSEEELSPFKLVKTIKIPQSIPDISLLKNKAKQNPILTRYKLIREKQLHIIDMEKSERIPNVTLGASYLTNRDSNSSSSSFSISFPLPLFNRNQGNIAAAEISSRQAILNYKNMNEKVLVELHGYYNELKNSFDEIALNKKMVLPKSLEAFKDIEKLYRKGRESYLSLSEAQRNFIDMKINQIDAITNFNIQKSNIESLLGVSFNSLSKGQNNE